MVNGDVVDENYGCNDAVHLTLLAALNVTPPTLKNIPNEAASYNSGCTTSHAALQ